MLKTSRLAALAILGVIAASPVYAEDKTAVKVNGISIPQELIDQRIKAITAQQGQPDTPELHKAVRDELINVELMSQEAVKKGLDKQPETIQQVESVKKQILAGAFMQDYVKAHPVSEEEITKAYDTWKNSLGAKEYHVRHILVEKESDAKSISAKLKKDGTVGNFEKLAKANSKDPGSKDRGGDLDWIPASKIPSAFVKPFADALLTLGKGQISEPVKSQFGWHIIKLEDVRDLKVPPLDEIKPQITQRLQQQALKKYVDDLRDKAKID